MQIVTMQAPALMEERVQRTFRRLPQLLAFSFDQDLALLDVELGKLPGCDWSDEVYAEVAQELSALVDDLAEDRGTEFLRGRTFARTVQ